MEPTAKIGVTPGRYVMICIGDTGSGMDKALWTASSSRFLPPRTGIRALG